MKPGLLLALLWSVAICSPLVAQTTTTYEAPTGSVSPSLQVTMHLMGGGSVVLNPVVGPNCYLGMTCGFPSGYVGTSMSYTLPDGSTAQLANFNGKFFGVGSNNYEVSGQASGTDTQGRNVTVDDVTSNNADRLSQRSRRRLFQDLHWRIAHPHRDQLRGAALPNADANRDSKPDGNQHADSVAGNQYASGYG